MGTYVRTLDRRSDAPLHAGGSSIAAPRLAPVGAGYEPGVVARLSAGALSVLALSFLSGCGDERGGEAHEAVTAAARATTDAGSARASLSMQGEAEGRTISIDGSEEIEFE